MTNLKAVEQVPRAEDYLVEVISVDLTTLFVDHVYQRSVSKGRVRYLVNNWSWRRYFPIIVAPRANRYAVIDGQQRFMAAQEIGIKQLPAILVISQSLEDEAEQYLGANMAKPVGAGDRFKARLVIKEPTAVEILRIVKNMGFQLRCALELEEQPTIFCIDAILALERVHNQNYLVVTLAALMRAFGAKPTKEVTTAESIQGMYLALRHAKRFNVEMETFVSKLGEASAVEIRNKSLDRYSSMTGVKSLPGAFASILIEHYNLGLRTGKLPPYDKKSSNYRPQQFSKDQGIASSLKMKRDPKGHYVKDYD